MQVGTFKASSEADIDDAFTSIVSSGFDVLIVSADPLFFNNRVKIVALCAHHSLPASYADHEYADAGGLVSYGASRSEAYRQAGIYVGRILKGEKASDLPVVLPTKFEFVINLKTATALGLLVPFALHAMADRVIE
jgi:putative ABC transport system substrate-binding protein